MQYEENKAQFFFLLPLWEKVAQATFGRRSSKGRRCEASAMAPDEG
jgi:hypothetical protein